jgi:hypothetical protein
MSDLGVTFHCDAEVVAAEGARNNVHIYRDGRVVLSLPFLAVLPGAGSGPGLVIAGGRLGVCGTGRTCWLIRRVLAAGRATTRPGRLMITEYCRFPEENHAVSMVFFRLGVKFRDHAAPRGAGGTHDATVSSQCWGGGRSRPRINHRDLPHRTYWNKCRNCSPPSRKGKVSGERHPRPARSRESIVTRDASRPDYRVTRVSANGITTRIREVVRARPAGPPG